MSDTLKTYKLTLQKRYSAEPPQIKLFKVSKPITYNSKTHSLYPVWRTIQ